MNRNRKKELIYLAIFSLCYFCSFLVPFSYTDCEGNSKFQDDPTYAKDLILPLFNFLPFVLFFIFAFINASNFTRWIAIIFAFIPTLAIALLVVFIGNFGLFCESKLGLGTYLYIVSTIILLILGIINFRKKVNKSYIEESALLDNEMKK